MWWFQWISSVEKPIFWYVVCYHNLRLRADISLLLNGGHIGRHLGFRTLSMQRKKFTLFFLMHMVSSFQNRFCFARTKKINTRTSISWQNNEPTLCLHIKVCLQNGHLIRNMILNSIHCMIRNSIIMYHYIWKQRRKWVGRCIQSLPA